MKNLHLLFFSILLSSGLFAQTSKEIENNLENAFMKIDYWGEHRSDKIEYSDSLSDANKVFCEMLYHYSTKYPFTIYQKFNKLEGKFDILTSEDNRFRIYSWDSRTGGTMHFFNNIFQYKRGNKTFAIVDTPKGDGNISLLFRKIYIFKNGAKRYYLCAYRFIESTKYYGEGVKVFAIKKGTLDNKAKIFKANSALTNDLSYEYDSSSLVDIKVKPEIYFNAATNTINLPLITSNGKVTSSYIAYKFTGQYFERVKN